MASELNFFDTYVLLAITEEIVPQQTFFKDRYFPTGEGDTQVILMLRPAC